MMVVISKYRLQFKECELLHNDAIRKKRELIKMNMKYDKDTWAYRYKWQCPKCTRILTGRMYRK